MNLIKKLTSPRSSQDLAQSAADIGAEINALEASRPALLQHLDDAVLAGAGEHEAEQALADIDAQLARMRVRLGAFERAHAEAAAKDERARVAALERTARDAEAACRKAAASYDTSARACAAAAKVLAEADGRAYAASMAAERAGGEPAGACYVSHVARGLNLPNSVPGLLPHHQAQGLNPREVALGQQVRDATAAGEQKLRDFAAGIRDVVQTVVR